MADVEIERKRVTLHPLDENGVVDTTVNLYPKTFIDGIVDRNGNPVDVLTDADIGHIQEEIEELSTDKQDVLVSRRNIKSINNQDILGEGNLEVGGKEPLYTEGDIEDLTSEQVESLKLGDQVIAYSTDLYTCTYADESQKYFTYFDEGQVVAYCFTKGDDEWLFDSSTSTPIWPLFNGTGEAPGKVLTTTGGSMEWKEPETKLNVDDIENLSDAQCNALKVGDVVTENSTREFTVSFKRITTNKKPYGILKLNSVESDTIICVAYEKYNSSDSWEYNYTQNYNLNTNFNHRYNSQVDIDSLYSDFVNQLELGDVVVCNADFKNYTVTYKEGVDLYLTHTESDYITNVFYSNGDYIDTYNVPLNVLIDGLSADVGRVLTATGNSMSWQPINTGEPEKITWSDLKAKKDNSQLVVGKQYRITDYTNSIINTFNTRSVDYVQFDIIVTAIRTNQLSENASACLKDNAYNTFSIDFSKWQLKYCLDNDTERFAWADGKGIYINSTLYTRYPSHDMGYGSYPICWVNNGTYKWTNKSNPSAGDYAYNYNTGGGSSYISSVTTNGNGKGVIYWMRDEWGNECPYDFKNTQFNYNDTRQGFGWRYVFTFSANYLNGSPYLREISIEGKCKNCVIKSSLQSRNLYKIPFCNLFYCVNNPSNYKTESIFKNNTIGYNCFENTILGTGDVIIEGNVLGDECYDNYIESNNNVLKWGCGYIKITADEEYLGSNIFDASCYNIKSADPQNVGDITGFCYNKFGRGCNNITLTSLNNCNTFGNNCTDISTNYTTKLYNAKIGDNCSNINFAITPVDGYVWIYNFIMDRNCKFLKIKGLNESEHDTGDIEINNSIHLHNDIQGTSSWSLKEIEIDLDLDHPVDYYANNQEDIII